MTFMKRYSAFPMSWLRAVGMDVRIVLLVVLGFVSVPLARSAEEVAQIRLGTLAPRGTSYYKSLMQMREKWRAVVGPTFRFTIYPDGTQGSESDMVGLMQTGNLDAGLLTAVGLSDIEPSISALQSMPMSFRSLPEVDYVGERLRPDLENRLLAKGYVVLFWVDSGWVRFFSKSPVVRPDDLRKLKVFTWAGNHSEPDIWKAAGFNPVSLETAGIGQGLLSGTITAVPMPPFVALAGQMDLQAKHMLELNWAPLVGAAVVRKKAWDRIAPEHREALLRIAKETGLQIKAAGRAESDASVEAMVKRGLTVHKVTPAVEEEWRAVAAQIENQIRGKVVPPAMYDEAQRALKEFREKAGSPAK